MKRRPPIPPPVIVIDTREQRPYEFSEGTLTVIDGMHTGDYSVRSIDGDPAHDFTERIVVERKSLEDYVGSSIHGRVRFIRELERLSKYDLACIVVEGDPVDAHEGRYRSRTNPASIVGSAAAFFIDYGVPTMFWGNRAATTEFVERLLKKYYERKMKEIRDKEASNGATE